MPTASAPISSATAITVRRRECWPTCTCCCVPAIRSVQADASALVPLDRLRPRALVVPAGGDPGAVADRQKRWRQEGLRQVPDRQTAEPMAPSWRARAAHGKLSAGEVVIEVTGRQSFVGSPETVAAAINERVQADAADGYILVPHITPDGLAPFVDKVVPLLQERGVSGPTTPAPRCATTSASPCSGGGRGETAGRASARPRGSRHEVHHHHADRPRPGPVHRGAEVDRASGSWRCSTAPCSPRSSASMGSG